MAAPTSPRRNAKTLQRRLATNDLTAEDQQNLTIVKQVLALRREGATLIECARHVGITEPKLRHWMRRQTFGHYVDYLRDLERAESPKRVREVVREAKEAFAQFAPDAIDFYRECFTRNPKDEQEEKGIFKDPARAEWATERVSKGLGLTEPDVATRPTITINSAVIVGELAVTARDDARADADAPRAIEVEAVDVTPAER